jgi:hypothetical protein
VALMYKPRHLSYCAGRLCCCLTCLCGHCRSCLAGTTGALVGPGDEAAEAADPTVLTRLFLCLHCTSVLTAAAARLGGQGRGGPPWCCVSQVTLMRCASVLLFPGWEDGAWGALLVCHSCDMYICCSCLLQLPGWEDRGVGGPGDEAAEAWGALLMYKPNHT